MRNIAASVALSVVFTLFPQLCHAAPVMKLSTDKWDMGEINQWTNPSLTVGITNAGDEDLVIKDVKSSCGCTSVLLSEKAIKPGETGFLRIDFSSYLSTGPVKKIVRLTTNDPARKVYDIRITGSVSEKKAAVGSLEEDYIDLGIVAPYETRYFDLVIRNNGNKPLAIQKVNLPEGFFLDSAHPSNVEKRMNAPVRIGYRPDRDHGLIYATIGFESGNNSGEKLEARVVGYIGESAVGADTLVLAPTGYEVRPNVPSNIRISIKNSGLSPVSIEGVDSSLKLGPLKGYQPFVPPGEAGAIDMTVEPGDMEPGDRGYIYIRLGIPVTVGGGR